MSPDSFFAVSAPGLELLTAGELDALGIAGTVEPGGVAFTGDAAALARANLSLRTATRVLVRLGRFRARTFAELERRAAELPWGRVLSAGEEYRLRVSCAKSKLYHEGAVEERLRRVIEAQTGARAALPVGEELDGHDAQLLVVRLFRDVCTVSADSSGAPLYMRGYRLELAKAPLRETLAAAMLLAARWPPSAPLLDPFCGSGTVAIEAALLARRIPPGLASPELGPRAFRFQRWPEHDARAFEAEVEEGRSGVKPAAPAPIFASDRDPGAVRAARANAERAGVAGDIEFRERDFSAFGPPGGSGWLVTNPPYGVRVGRPEENQELFRLLAREARTRLAGWTLVALAPPDGPVSRALGRSAALLLRTRNGGIPVELRVRPPVGSGAERLSAAAARPREPRRGG